MPSQQWKLRTYYVAKQPFRIQWTNIANQFREHCQHSVHTVSRHFGHSWIRRRAKITYKEPTCLETNSTHALSNTKTVNPETKFQNWNWKHTQNLGNELLNTQKTMDKEIREAGVWKPNFAKITSVSSQKQTWAKVNVRLKQSLYFTKSNWGHQFQNHASNGRHRRRTDLFPDGVWGLGIWAPATHGNSKQIISKISLNKIT